jgi:tetratricopeptide (TPR) repeat protein
VSQRSASLSGTSIADARGYITQSLQPTEALREETREAAETALALQPNLGEAVLAEGLYYYSCLKDYDTAMRYFEQARQFLPSPRPRQKRLTNNSTPLIPQSFAITPMQSSGVVLPRSDLTAR